ncbi:anti-sigma factor family protein [Nocardioides speluncae]|uniref:anti-sigma factor family protein n=1 Tax=Nocardioides speluncae TaxID=2670337 RepID=UPI000D69E09D|nr:zf-HC2 domain-containing protein [Nocardioides speluncae]
MRCEFAHLDGSYVLGALAAAERTAFERHLAGCDECSRSVRELAGLPGLMGRVPLEVLEPPGQHEPVPDTLLPAVVSEVRRSRRRRMGAVAGVAAAAATIVVAGLVGVAVTALDSDDENPQAGPPITSTTTTEDAVRMESLGSGRVTGWITLTEKPWGTRIDLNCTYGGGSYGGGEDSGQGRGRGGPPTYVMFVRATDGEFEQVGTWTADYGSAMHVTMAAAPSPEDIEEVLVKTGEGKSVLRLVK